MVMMYRLPRIHLRPFSILLGGLAMLAVAGCSGEDRVLKQLEAPGGLMLLDGGLDPGTPAALERAQGWALAREAETVTLQVAFVDTVTARQAGFLPSRELFSPVSLEAMGPPDLSGIQRFEGRLPPRPEGRILYYWFEARSADDEEARLPAAAPEGAIPVGIVPLEIATPRPPWSQPYTPIACWASPEKWNPDFSGAGPNFDEIVDPIWKSPQEQSIFASTIGVRSGIGVIVEGVPYFYPLNIMLWNEVANAVQDGIQTVMSYCPLTDSALFFQHHNNAKTRLWQTAGLFNSNLVVGDPRQQASAVPQLLAFGVTGSRTLQCVEVLPSFLSDYDFWLSLHPDTRVLNGDRSLTDWNWLNMNNPYRFYWRDHEDIRAPLAHVDQAHPLGLQNKDSVVGVIGGAEPTAFAVHRPVPTGVVACNDDGGGRPMVLFWVQGPHFAAVFDRTLPSTGQVLGFRRAAASFRGTPLFEDDQDEPSLWTVEGLAVAGPLAGEQLAWLPSTRVFWFAWHATYPQSRLVDPLASAAP